MSFTSATDRPVIPNVLVEHLEEVAYLSIQRRKLLFSAEIPLRRFREHDGRIEAHLDGLREGGLASVRIAEERLTGEDPWFVYAAARVWLAQGQPDASAVLERLKTLPPELAPAWKEALRNVSVDVVRRVLSQKGVDALPPPALEVAVDAWAWHGLLSIDAGAMLLESPHPRIRFTVARHGCAGSASPKLFEDTEPLVRRAALWSLALRDARSGLDYTRRTLQAGDADPFLARVLGLFGERGDGKMLVSLLSRGPAAVAAIAALRELGHGDFAEMLVEYMEAKDEAIASAAGEAVESLVGRIPPLETEKPAPPGVSPLRFRWQQVRPKLDLTGRKLGGQPFPWKGEAAEEPMEYLWRASLMDRKPENAWLRREVPDGFFTGFPSFGALPGE
jgi:hypothetical protein